MSGRSRPRSAGAVEVETHQPYRPRWPRWRHGDRRPVDLTTMEVPCAEEMLRTKHGLWRPEHGVVRYSVTHWMKFRADAEDLLYILRNQVPANCKDWSLHLLNKAYCSSCRRYGSWDRLNICLHDFLSLFPRTFELFGERQQLVRALRLGPAVSDGEEEVMRRLALAKRQGVIHAQTPIDGLSGEAASRLIFSSPEVAQSYALSEYIPSRAGSKQNSVASRPTTAAVSSRPTSAFSRPSRPLSATSRPVSAARSRPASAGSYQLQMRVGQPEGLQAAQVDAPLLRPLELQEAPSRPVSAPRSRPASAGSYQLQMRLHAEAPQAEPMRHAPVEEGESP